MLKDHDLTVEINTNNKRIENLNNRIVILTSEINNLSSDSSLYKRKSRIIENHKRLISKLNEANENYKVLITKYGNDSYQQSKYEVIAPSLIDKCKKLSIRGSMIGLYYLDGDVRVTANEMNMFSQRHIWDGKGNYYLSIMINDYESFIPDFFKDKKQLIRKVEKKLVSLILKYEKFKLDENSFNLEKIQDYLIFS